MIKGYEFSKGQYVQFTAEELKALDERGTGAIDVKEFLPAEQVDRIFLEKTYFLGPDKGGERAYRLLAEALKKTGRVAIGQYAARGKGYLIMIRPIGGRLAMEQLRYADELRSIDEVPVGEVDVKPAELELAVQFIEQAATDQFRPRAELSRCLVAATRRACAAHPTRADGYDSAIPSYRTFSTFRSESCRTASTHPAGVTGFVPPTPVGPT